MTETAIRNRIVGHGAERADQLLANPFNFRRHGAAQRAAIAGSLEELGWVKTVLVNRTTGHVIDGHARIEDALERDGEVPVTYVELTDQEERLALAVLDPISAMATQDAGIFTELVSGIEAQSSGVRDLIARMLEDNRLATNGATDPDEAPPLPPEPETHAGDLITLGRHRLLCGDSTNAADLARLMGGVQAEVLWTDPPYGVSYVGKTADALTIENDGSDGLEALLDAAFAAADLVLAPNARVYVCTPAGPIGTTFRLCFSRSGWRLHQSLVWVKDVFVLGHSDYHYQHEDVLYGFKPGDGRPGRGNHDGSRWFGGHSQSSVLEIPRPKRSTEHPTMKPVELITRCLNNSAPFRGPVLDPFGGSGTTLVAAEATGRTAYLCEIDPKYCDVIVKRFEALTGLTAERERA